MKWDGEVINMSTNFKKKEEKKAKAFNKIAKASKFWDLIGLSKNC